MNHFKRLLFALVFTSAMVWLAATIAFAQSVVTVPDQATWLAVLQAFGLSKYAASIVAIVGMFGFILVHVMPYIPAPSETAPTWWRTIYGVLTFLAGNYFNAKNTPAAAASAQSPASMPTIVALLIVGLALSACAKAPAAVPAGPSTSVTSVSTTVNAGIAEAQTAVAVASNLWGIAQGLADVAGVNTGAVAPAVNAALATAQAGLNAVAVDAPAVEALAQQVVGHANQVTLAAAPLIKAVPAATPNAAAMPGS